MISKSLFLINPNGIVFGPQAALDVGGSFTATTANAIRLGNLGLFSAAEPASSTLLAVDPSAYLWSTSQIQPIQTRATGLIIATNTGQPSIGLQVSPEQTIMLLGGDVIAERASINAPGGRIEIGGISQPGTINLDGTALQFPQNVARSNISIRDQTSVNVLSGKSGSITIYANDVEILSSSSLSAGIVTTFSSTTNQNQAGDILIDAQGEIKLRNSLIQNRVFPGTIGSAGQITVKGRILSVDNAAILSLTQGTGNAGEISIQTQGKTSINGNSLINSNVASGGIGNSANVEIEAGELVLTSGGQIQTRVQEAEGTVPAGRGNAGQVKIRVPGQVLLEGVSSNGQTSNISSSISTILSPGASGSAGDIDIKAGSLSLLNGANFSATTYGQGNGGSILVEVDQSLLIKGQGTGNLPAGQVAILPSGISSFTANFRTVPTSGNSGRIDIKARSISLEEGGFIGTETSRQGDAGRISIDASESITLSGVGSTQSSLISSSIAEGGSGSAGDINLTTQKLVIADGGAITSASNGVGKAGKITVTATDEVRLQGQGTVQGNLISSQIFAIAGEQGRGDANNITLSTASLQLSKGAFISSETRRLGNAGNIVIQDVKTAFFSESEISTAVTATGIGQGGRIQFEADTIELDQGTLIRASSEGIGDAGSIVISTNGRLSLRGSTILTASTQSSGGEIALQASSIRLLEDSNIITSVFNGIGKGGDITLTAPTIVALGRSDILAFANPKQGAGGNIRFNTEVFLSPPSTQIGQVITTLDELIALRQNDRIDVNASGQSTGAIAGIPDSTFLQNSLSELQQNAIDTNALLANSCIARNQQNGSFYLTGTGGLPTNPGDLSAYPTGTIQPTWKPGDTIVEPQGVYPLPNGQLVMSRECDRE
jgi:large exoprotein involved in heme utilization and adhesion